LHNGKSAPQPPSSAGSFSEWSYFHFGRWTFAARGWWVPPAAAERSKSEAQSAEASGESKADSEKPDGGPESNLNTEQEQDAAPQQEIETDPGTETTAEASSENASEGESEKTAAEEPSDSSDNQTAIQENPPLAKDDKRGADDLNALAWYKSQGIEAFVEWQPFEHPNFVGKQVEIGGFKPHALLNPPSHLIAPLVKPHLDFLKEIAKNLPKIEIRDLKVEVLGAGLFDISCSVVNVGQLPTMPLMGSTNRQWYPIQVEIIGVDALRWIEGSPRQSVGRLTELGGAQELRWVFLAKEVPDDSHEFTISAYSPTLHPAEVKVTIPTGSP